MIWEQSSNLNEIACSGYLQIVYGTNSLADNLAFHQILTHEELTYSERLKDQERKKGWLSCRASLRLILGSYLGKSPFEIEFMKGKFGKLYVSGSNLHFSVSHSNHSFLLGFNASGRIGVDMEKLSGREDLPSLIGYAFSEAEADYCNNGDLVERFTEVWTMKEAFLKALGVGLVDQLTAITVTETAGNNISRLNLNQKSFICPNGETGSIVFRNNMPLKFSWLTDVPAKYSEMTGKFN